MKPTTEILARISQNSLANKEEVFTKLYRYLLRPDIYFVAYKNLYANNGAATKGVNEDTADGFSEAKIDSIIKALADETYQPMPVRRTYIQKKNNRKKLRPLGIPTFTDKLVQEVLRMILEAVYEPIFLDVSHGFRPKRSCHTALKQLRREFNGTRWFVEGDIKGCFDNIMFIGIVVDNINWSIDRQLLTWFHGSAAVTVYVIASQLNNYFLLFGNAISNVMTPRVHRLVAENAPMRTLDALFTKVGRLQFILLGGIFLGFVAIGQSFVVLWGGGEQFRIDYWTALLLFFACLWTNIQTVGIEIQRAKNMHKYRSLVYLGVLVGNIVISIPLCMKWQGLGAAIGTAVATLVGNVFLMNRYYYKHIGLNIPGFWNGAARFAAMFSNPTQWSRIIARGASGGTSAICCRPWCCPPPWRCCWRCSSIPPPTGS